MGRKPKAAVSSNESLDPAPISEEKPGVSIVTPDQFAQQIEALRLSKTIKNDEGEEVKFEGKDKEEFIRLVQEGYPVVKKMVETISETGGFLYKVRKILKPKKLFLSWMKFTGFPRRNSYNYLLVYRRFGDKLPQFSHLGIRKLLAASKLKNCVEYIEKHAEAIAKVSAEEFEKTVRKLRAKNKKTDGRGRKPSYTEVGGCKVRQSTDGTRIVIEGLSKDKQKALFEAIKASLSQ